MLELQSKTLRAVFNPFGARLVSLFVGETDVVMGAAEKSDLEAGEIYAGAVCGRIAGRITNARIALDGKTYALTPNMDGHQLHGGPDNFAARDWQAEPAKNSIRFTIKYDHPSMLYQPGQHLSGERQQAARADPGQP